MRDLRRAFISYYLQGDLLLERELSMNKKRNP